MRLRTSHWRARSPAATLLGAMCRLRPARSPRLRRLRAAVQRGQRAPLPVAPAPARLGHRLVRRWRPARPARILPAHADESFLAAGREVRSAVVLAHVREASVGPVLPENTHPFLFDRWLFAHNGTVARFRDVPAVRGALEAEIDHDLRLEIRGDTDSERVFYLFLTRPSRPRLRARGGPRRRPRRPRRDDRDRAPDRGRRAVAQADVAEPRRLRRPAPRRVPARADAPRRVRRRPAPRLRRRERAHRAGAGGAARGRLRRDRGRHRRGARRCSGSPSPAIEKPRG